MYHLLRWKRDDRVNQKKKNPDKKNDALSAQPHHSACLDKPPSPFDAHIHSGGEGEKKTACGEARNVSNPDSL